MNGREKGMSIIAMPQVRLHARDNVLQSPPGQNGRNGTASRNETDSILNGQKDQNAILTVCVAPPPLVMKVPGKDLGGIGHHVFFVLLRIINSMFEYGRHMHLFFVFWKEPQHKTKLKK